jgi:hypothetical protein
LASRFRSVSLDVSQEINVPVSIDTFRQIAQNGGSQQVLLDASHTEQATEIKTRGQFASWVVNLFRGDKVRTQQQVVAQSFLQVLQDNVQRENPSVQGMPEQLRSDYRMSMQEALSAVRRQLANQLDGTRALTADDIQLALKFVSEVQEQTLAPLLEEASQMEPLQDAALRQAEPGLPETSAGLVRVVEDRATALRQALLNAGGDAELEAIAQDVHALAKQDVAPRERLQQIQMRLNAAELPVLPASANSPLAACLTQLHVLKSGVDAHLAAPVPDNEPAFLDQQEQTKALQDLHVREKAVVSWNLALREARDVCRFQAEHARDRRYGDLSGTGAFAEAYRHLSHLQDILLDPGQRLDRTFFQALEHSLLKSVPDLPSWAQADGAAKLSPQERAVFSRLQQVASQTSVEVSGQDDPDIRTDQWLRETAVFAERGTRLSDEALFGSEKKVLHSAMAAGEPVRLHAQAHPQDADIANVAEMLTYWRWHTDSQGSGLSVQSRLRTLVDWGSDGAAGIDRAIHLAATRGDVNLTSALLDVREALKDAQQSVYPGRLGYSALDISQGLRDEVGRAQLRQADIAREAAAQWALEDGNRVELPPEVPRELKAQRAVALPSSAPQASAQLAEALQVAFLRFEERGALGRRIHKELNTKYKDAFMQAHAALSANETRQLSQVEELMKARWGETFWNANFGGETMPALERLQRAAAILEPLRGDIMKDIAARKDRSDSRRVLENVLQNFVLASAVLDHEATVEEDDDRPEMTLSDLDNLDRLS